MDQLRSEEDQRIVPDLSAKLEGILPSQDDIAAYRELGYWVSPPIIPGDVLDAAERGQRRIYAGDVDAALPTGDRRFGWTPADGDVLRKNDYTSVLVRELAMLVRHPAIAACAARLSGHAGLRLWHDQLLYKPVEREQAVRVGWHTDRQYWMTCSSQDMLTAWVPFHDIGPEDGPISFVEGSHLWPEDITLDFWNQDMTAVEDARNRHGARVVAVTMPRGAMSFHHCRTIHGSGPNRSDHPRRALAIHLQPQDNRYVRRPRPDGTPYAHGNDRLVRRLASGDPDYADPIMCPVLWPLETRAGEP